MKSQGKLAYFTTSGTVIAISDAFFISATSITTGSSVVSSVVLGTPTFSLKQADAPTSTQKIMSDEATIGITVAVSLASIVIIISILILWLRKRPKPQSELLNMQAFVKKARSVQSPHSSLSVPPSRRGEDFRRKNKHGRESPSLASEQKMPQYELPDSGLAAILGEGNYRKEVYERKRNIDGNGTGDLGTYRLMADEVELSCESREILELTAECERERKQLKSSGGLRYCK